MAFQSSKTLFELTNFLTRPLMKAYPSVTVLFHRQILQKQLQAAFFSTMAPFSLFLSPYTLPPMPVYTACLMSGIKWADWARLLAPEGQGVVVFVMDGKIQVKSPNGSELVTVWSQSSEAASSTSRPTLSSLSRALESVRSRSTTTVTTTVKSPSKVLAKPLTTATIIPAVSRLRTPFQRKPTPLSQVIMISDDEDEDEEDDCDSDSESDAGSTISSSSSLFSAASSSGSVTSVASSTCSSPAQSKPTLDLIRASITTKTMPTTTTKPKVSPIMIPARRTAPTASRPDLRLVDRTKTDVTRYNYQGGQTAVMTGGVMLGGVRSKGASSPSSTNGKKKSNNNRSAGASMNWRRA